MKKPALLLVLAVSLALIISACGGGGGGGSTTPTVTTASISGSAVGTVGISSLVGTSKAGVSKSAGNGELIGGAKVVIESYHNGQLHKTYETVTDPNLGTFNIPIQLWSDGGYIVVNIEKDGLVKYSKTFTYSKPEDLKGLNLKAELAPYLMKTVTFGDISETFKSAEDDLLSIAVVENRNGIKKVAVNNEIKVAKASGETIKWQMDLSKSKLKAADVGNSMTIKVQNFDATSSEDMKSFPSDSDSSGNKLVSTGFDFIDIKTGAGKSFCIDKSGNYGTLASNGECIVPTGSAVRQALISKSVSSAKFKVKRQIDDCALVTKDEDPNMPGVQVGFYIQRNGKWVKLGNATLYSKTPSGFDNYSTFYGNKASCENDGKPYAVFTEEDIKKASQSLGFDLSWYNFDYVAMGELKTFCIEGEFKKVKKNEKSALSSLYLYLQNLQNNSSTVTGFRSAYGYTDENGKFKIEGVTSAIDANYDIELSYSDPFTGKWIQKNKKLKAKAASGCYQVDVEEVTDPFECTVTGTAKKTNGHAYTNKYLYAYVKDKWYGYQYRYTDSNGSYTIPVVCGENYVLTDGVTTFDFYVNGTISSQETDDTGKQVVLNPQFPNQKPYVYAYANQYNIKTGETLQLYGYAWDPDGDTLTYTWQVTPSNGTISDHQKTNLTWKPKAQGTYTLTLTVSDGSSSSDATIEVKVEDGDRPPKITYMYIPTLIAKDVPVTLYATAYDPDGDNLSYKWVMGNYSTVGNKISWTPTETGNIDVTIRVTANSKSDERIKTVNVLANNPPKIVSANYPSKVDKGEKYSLSAYAYDPEGETVSYEWFLDNNSISKSNSFVWDTSSVTAGSYKIKLSVKDSSNNEASKTFDISVNTKPTVTNINVSPSAPQAGQTVTLTAVASDADNDTLIYEWYIQNVKQTGTGSSITWVPSSAATYTIEVRVSDGKITTPVSFSKQVTVTGAVINQPPTTPTISVTPGKGQYTLSATATDPDNGPSALTYTWYIDGTLLGTGSTIVWPISAEGTYIVKVVVSDGVATAEKTQSVTVTTNIGIIIQ